jgi:hypothetical protein
VVSTSGHFRPIKKKNDGKKGTSEVTKLGRKGAEMKKSTAAYSINNATRTTGTLRVKRAATVICVRPRPECEERRYKSERRDTLNKWDCMGIPKGSSGSSSGTREDADGRVNLLFGNKEERTFVSSWQVLMAQSEVVNWIRSSREQTSVMRYAGEWKVGGSKQHHPNAVT